ncbi:MAG: hypothetical protein ACRDOP_16600 [Gaiellaceae bacterium]
MTSGGGHGDSSRSSSGLDPAIWTGAVAIVAAVLIAPLATASPTLTVVGAGVVVLAAAVAVHPPLAAYALLGATPLIVGVDRGLVIPVLRPNEALALVLAAGLSARVLGEILAGRPFRPRLGRVDLAILALAVTGSVLPLLWMHARGDEITRDDVLYALTLWKYYGLYLIVRTSVRSVRDVRICLWLSLAAAGVVALVAILQALQLFGVPELLATYYAPLGQTDALDNMRGSSTIAAPQAVADVMTFNLAIAAGLLLRGSPGRAGLVALSLLLVFGALASGQFSGVLALLVGVIAFGYVTGRLTTTALAFVPAAIAAAFALRPVVDRRIAGFESAAGIPPSWTGRIENLQTHFLPELSNGWNALLGVRPAARVPAPADSGRDWIFIESGYVWLVWSGGISLVVAFAFFLWTTLRQVASVARARADAVGVAATASFTALVVVAVLQAFDPHLTLRGAGDLCFFLLGLALSGVWRQE